jgi:hypothetical protein
VKAELFLFDFHDVKAYAGVEAGFDLRTIRS